tara:strand:- start:319 stop:486 length:168 start_codon:yes stop_codon:yes gene_type:complete
MNYKNLCELQKSKINLLEAEIDDLRQIINELKSILYQNDMVEAYLQSSEDSCDSA